MKIKGPILLIVIFVFSILTSAAQDDAKLVGRTEQTVQVGDRFRVVYEFNADGSNFKSPNFGKLQVISGPNKSSSSSIQIINGNYQQSYTQTYTYIVTASETGNYYIGPASIRLKKENIVSNSLSVKIVNKAANKSSAAGQRSSSQQKQDGTLNDDDVYIKTFVSKTNPYLGEQVILTTRIYTKVPVSNLSLEKAPSYEGFWSKSLTDENTQLKQSTQKINGVEYIVADISKYALFPQKSGELIIEGTKMNCVAQVRIENTKRRSRDPYEDFFNDPFFNRNVKNVQVALNSKSIKLKVKPLPQQGKPSSFTGAVGRFSFSSSLESDTISSNDAINISLKLMGTGNLELVNPPEILFPSDFETYEPKINNKINTAQNGISGTKKIEYLAIARNPGDFIINPIEFSYFNPSDEKYHKITAGPYNLHILKGNNTSSGISYSSSAQEDIVYIGKDIRHIKQTEFKLVPLSSFLFGSVIYYISIILPLALVVLIVIFIQNRRKQRGDVKQMKTKKANKVARQKLQKAEKLMSSGNDKEFYEEIAQGLWGYIADKFHIAQADMSMENVKDTLRNKGIEEDIVDGFINTLNNIEFARFAPGDASGKMKNIYEESIDTITKSEKALK